MQNYELFYHNPLEWKLLNDGVSSNNSTDERTLEYELKTFVCEGKYQLALERILHTYLSSANKSDIPSGWISGFYGSGKSHLVKILRYLWNDHTLSTGASARSLATLPLEVSELLTELSTLGKKGAGLLSVGGTLKSGTGSVRLRLLSIIFKSIGLPESFPQAKLLLRLKEDGKLDAFTHVLTENGKNLDRELKKIYTSKAIQEAYLRCYPHLETLPAVAETLRSEFPDQKDISINELLETIRSAISKDGELPYTLIALDELQQFIGEDAQVALDVQEIAESCSKEMDNRVMIVATGQSALTNTPNLQRLLGRFTIRDLSLSDSDVEAVIRQVALRKKDEKIQELDTYIETHKGEITRQLVSTQICTQDGDSDYYNSDYPLLPVRRRFWEKVLRSIDSSGTAGQLRTQLRVVHEANREFAQKPVGHTVPADFIFDQLSTQLVTLGELPRRFQEIIQEQKTKPDGEFRSRVCALIYLMNKVPSEAGNDLGVRANEEQVADLLISDIDAGGAEIRSKLPATLEALVQDGVLIKLDEGYNLQTTEGAVWQNEFERHLAQLNSDTSRISNERNNRLQAHVNKELGSLTVLHGAAKARRPVRIHHGMTPPEPTSDGILLWVRSGWSEPRDQVLNHIRSLPSDDTTLFLFIPEVNGEQLKSALTESLAAESTLTAKGIPSTPEGLEAREAMESRSRSAKTKVESLLNKITKNTELYLAGGESCSIITLPEAVQDAAQSVLTNVYPKFSDADSSEWSKVLKLAKEGNKGALSKTGHQDDPETHPVARTIIHSIGASKRGSELRKEFAAAPYGWEQDAVDATLATLLLTGHLNANYQGTTVTEKSDQRTLGSATYSQESVVISLKETMALKKFMHAHGVVAGKDDVAEKAKHFVTHMIQLANSAGGEAPLPAKPSHPALIELAGQAGNSLIKGILDRKEILEGDISGWQTSEQLISERLPLWTDAQALATELSQHPQAEKWQAELNAIQEARTLLNEQDPITPLRLTMTEAARTELNSRYATYQKQRTEALTSIQQNEKWSALSAEEQERKLQQAGAGENSSPEVSDTKAILQALHSCSFRAWNNRIDALSAQFSNALSTYLKELEPKAQRVTLPSTTLTTEADLDAWLAATKADLTKALEKGPVIL